MSKQYRDPEIQAIVDCLCSYEPLHGFSTILFDVAKEIESSIYDATIDKSKEKRISPCWSNDYFLAIYSSLGYNVKINLDINSSINEPRTENVRTHTARRIHGTILVRYLRHMQESLHLFSEHTYKLICNFIPHFDLSKIGHMSSYDLNPHINEPYIEQIRTRQQQEIQIKYSTIYTCSRCQSKKTIYYEIQTRSLDEGGTLFIECVECHKVWRSYQ